MIANPGGAAAGFIAPVAIPLAVTARRAHSWQSIGASLFSREVVVKLRFPLHVHISTLFLTLILLAGGLLGGIGYLSTRHILESSADEIGRRAAQQIGARIEATIAPVEMAIGIATRGPLALAATHAERMRALPAIRESLARSAAAAALYAGYADGDFFMVGKLPRTGARSGAPEGAAYLVQSIDVNVAGRTGRRVFLDADLEVLREDDAPDYASTFDPRARDWFAQAQESARPIRTAPYVFFSSGEVGITLAARSPGGQAVIGGDIVLRTLRETLRAQKITPGAGLALVDGEGRPLATSGDDSGPLRAAAPLEAEPSPVLAAAIAGQTEVRAGGRTWRAQVLPLPAQPAGLRLVSAVPDDELLADAFALRRTAAWITAAIVVLTVCAAWAAAHAVARPLRQLAEETAAIRNFDFERPTRVRTRVREVFDLAVTVSAMKRTIRRFLHINAVVAAEADFDRLLPTLLGETRRIAGADAGVLYLVDGDALTPAAASRGLAARPLPAEPGPPLGDALASGEPRVETLDDDARAALGLGATARHALAVPLRNRQHALVGALLLLRTAPFAESQVAFVSALSGAATSSLEARELLKAQREMFESLVRLLAGAIDAKSPYTGGHCARVPEIAKRLARAACDARSGRFADYALDAEGWEALHVAAWLHDCGKVTTPEYVVDKATKLETLHDRIHEVRTRFEVLKRDAEIARLKAVLAGVDAGEAQAARNRAWADLDADFAFVAACNIGGESLGDAAIARLREIGARTWTRTLDDRLGVSPEEAARHAGPPPALPATEPLLADKPEHRIPRGPADRLAADARFGFHMAVPELLYDRGELHNLTVARGTLTAEERYKINDHIVQTIAMLSAIPFPRHLRAVPEIAGGHHEKVDGTGYPRRLTGAEMSVEARMMAIADVFEALTAADRPYKSGKPLSEAMAILARMVERHELDADLFELFVESGAYADYARAYLAPGQIDAVDLDACRVAVAAARAA